MTKQIIAGIIEVDLRTSNIGEVAITPVLPDGHTPNVISTIVNLNLLNVGTTTCLLSAVVSGKSRAVGESTGPLMVSHDVTMMEDMLENEPTSGTHDAFKSGLVGLPLIRTDKRGRNLLPKTFYVSLQASGFDPAFTSLAQLAYVLEIDSVKINVETQDYLVGMCGC